MRWRNCRQNRRAREVIAASAGNHALGLAWHGRAAGRAGDGRDAAILRPLVKVARCRLFGATVVLHGDTFDEARCEANRLAAERRLTYIHPFDDPQVIAGQGTLAFEILEQVAGRGTRVAGGRLGGGGLLAGVATVWQALKPELQIIGVEAGKRGVFLRPGWRRARRCGWRQSSRWRTGWRWRKAGQKRAGDRESTGAPVSAGIGRKNWRWAIFAAGGIWRSASSRGAGAAGLAAVAETVICQTSRARRWCCC